MIELTVDVQMRDYGATEEHARSGCLRRGLWKFSRHPDYFGEALF